MTQPVERPVRKTAMRKSIAALIGPAATSSVVAYGAFTAGGVDVQRSNTTDIFKFPGGSFRLTHKITGGHTHFSKATCAGMISQRGPRRMSVRICSALARTRSRWLCRRR